MEHGLHRCVHEICIWSRETEREQAACRGSTAGLVGAALTGLESDLSALEELAADGVAIAAGELDGMSERLTRVIAALRCQAA